MRGENSAQETNENASVLFVSYNIFYRRKPEISKKVSLFLYPYAAVAEQADAQDLKSWELITRTGSIPVCGTKDSKFILEVLENYHR